MARGAHLVGTVPVATTREAMELAAAELGPTLRWLPDGETGPRFNWVAPIIDGLREHPDLELARDGDWSDYDRTPQFRVRRGHKLRGDSLEFGHVAWFRDSLPEFRRTRDRLGVPELAFQIGVPGPFDMAGLALGPRGALLHRRPFHDATVAEITTIQNEAGREVVFQLEVPFELVFVAQAPRQLRPLVARWLGGVVTAVAGDAPAGTRFGIHLCLGDLQHKSLANMRDAGPVVALANAIAAAWPAGRELEYVHGPFAGASLPPPTDAAYYAPLCGLRLPGRTRFVAGFTFEHQSADEQLSVLELIERAYGRPVDVSAACGLGRRSYEDAVASMRRARLLAES